MTVSVKVSVNGNYKVPVSFEQGDRKESFEVSGKGHTGPNEVTISFYHGPDALNLKVGPEVPDNDPG